MNRKIWIKTVSLIFLLVMLAILISIVLNLHIEFYNTRNVYAKGLTLASPTVNQQIPHQSGSQPNSSLDPAIFLAIGAVLTTAIAAIGAIVAAIRPVIEGISQIIEALSKIIGTVNSQTAEHAERSKPRKLWQKVYSSVRRVEIPDFGKPLDMNSLYVPAKVTRQFSSTADFSKYPNATNRDVNTFLQEQQKAFLERFNDAKDLREGVLASKLDDENGIDDTAPRFLLTGHAGIGKTMQLKHYALEYIYPQNLSQSMNSTRSSWLKRIRSDHKLPIYIELKAFAEAKLEVANRELSLVNFIVQKWEKDYKIKGLLKYLEGKLENEQAAFLLDGLDETFIGNNPLRTYGLVIDAISKLGTIYTKAPIIVSTRDSHYQFYKEQGWSLMKAGFFEWELLGFRPEDIELFITKWFQCSTTSSKKTDITNITQKLEANPRIQALASNPLFLIHIIRNVAADWNLPDQRADLYREGARLFLAMRDKTSVDKKFIELTKIAWRFHKGEEYHLCIEHLMQTNVPETEQNVFRSTIQTIVEDGLLQRRGKDYYFFCLSLQEYFAASNAKINHEAKAALEQYRQLKDPWWEEVISLYDKLG